MKTLHFRTEAEWRAWVAETWPRLGTPPDIQRKWITDLETADASRSIASVAHDAASYKRPAPFRMRRRGR